MSNGERRRVVITGMGLVCPLGVGLQEPWKALLDGASGIGPITLFDASDLRTRFAGEVPNFDPHDFMSRSDVKKGDRFIHYAVAAGSLAMADADLEAEPERIPRERFGSLVGVGFGGISKLETRLEQGPVPALGLSPYALPSILPNLAAGQLGARYGLKGPCLCPATACAAGLHAIGQGYAMIRDGLIDGALCGGSEGALCRITVQGFNALRALSTHEDFARASRPFDYRRDGFVIGEGSGMLVLEELESATRRNAPVYAEVAGFGLSGDGYHLTAPDPEGDGALRAMAMAVRESSMPPTSIGYINAHGTSTPHNDYVEIEAIKRLFGTHAHDLCVSSTKSATGHLLGGAGGVETVFTALALRHGAVPPTINFETAVPPEPDDRRAAFACDPAIDYVPNEAREVELEAALCNAFGFGGTNGSLALRRWDG